MNIYFSLIFSGHKIKKKDSKGRIDSSWKFYSW